MKLASKLDFISRKYELPLLDHNAEWLTNKWIYVITAVIGAVTGIRMLEYTFTGWSFGAAAGGTLIYGLIFVFTVWAGCTAVGFVKIPVLRYAVSRSVFELVALLLTFVICAILGAVALFLILILLILALLGGLKGLGGVRRSASPDTVYDGEGNIHYVSSQDGDRVITTGGDTMRRMPDGTYRNLHND